MSKNEEIEEIKHQKKIYHQKLLQELERQINASGGIFVKKTRERILGKRGMSGRYRTKTAFWCEMRDYVKIALFDLRLFIEIAGDKYVDEALTEKNLEPVVKALLLRPVLENAKPDLERAEIAKLFIQAGFEYLMYMQKEHVTGLYKRAIDDGIDACSYLVQLFRNPDEKKGVSVLERPRR